MIKEIYSFTQRKIARLDEDTAWSRAMCAKLRRGIGKKPGALPEIWEMTLSELQDEWLSRDGSASYVEYTIHTVLTLYALHRQGKTRSMNVNGRDENGKEKGDSFGAATARLISNDVSNLDAVKRRFDATATSTEFTELARHARGIIQMLRNEDIPLNYPRFAQDLYLFQLPGRADDIRLRWGEDFYRVLNKNSGKDKDEQ